VLLKCLHTAGIEKGRIDATVSISKKRGTNVMRFELLMNVKI